MFLSLEETPLEFELEAIYILNFFHLLLNGLQFLDYHCKIIVFYGIVPIDLDRRPWKSDLSDNVAIEFAV